MENEIKNIYTTLSGGKLISSGEYVITGKDFSSIMRDRFVADLWKRGIKWNGENIAFSQLLSSVPGEAIAIKSTPIALPATDNTASASSASVGIDMQAIHDLPACVDYWEDAFYRSKFKPAEIAYCVKKDEPRQSFAGIYACKEALIKCNNQLQWDDITIAYDDNGKPGFNGYALSASHSGGFAIAVALKNEAALPALHGTAAQPVVNNMGGFTETKTVAKNYNKYFVLVIAAIVVYIVLRDFVLR